jgi:REP element-mobilizing transposase RayT
MEFYFGKIQNNEMIYDEIGRYAQKCICDIPDLFPDAGIIISQVMPNHVHLIVEIQNLNKNTYQTDTPVETMHASSLQQQQQMSMKNKNSRWKNEKCDEKMQNISNKRGRLSYVTGSLKSAITKFATKNNIEFGWQSRFHDHIIRSQDELERIFEYIQNNVTTWNNDRFNKPAK